MCFFSALSLPPPYLRLCACGVGSALRESLCAAVLVHASPPPPPHTHTHPLTHTRSHTRVPLPVVLRYLVAKGADLQQRNKLNQKPIVVSEDQTMIRLLTALEKKSEAARAARPAPPVSAPKGGGPR
jgi:hypothetical protein